MITVDEEIECDRHGTNDTNVSIEICFVSASRHGADSTASGATSGMLQFQITTNWLEIWILKVSQRHGSGLQFGGTSLMGCECTYLPLRAYLGSPQIQKATCGNTLMISNFW